MAALGRISRLGALTKPQGTRGMATLKEISMRLSSVKSISKITSSMKMVSAAKFARAEKALQTARANGLASVALAEKAGAASTEDESASLTVAISSDRGLCGGIHSGVCKHILNKVENPGKLVCVGDKSRSILSRNFKDSIVLSANEYGRTPPAFFEASFVANEIIKSGENFTDGRIVYNYFRNAASYVCSERPLLTTAGLSAAESINDYDGNEEETLQSYVEFSTAANIYHAMLENAASEQSSRMTAMENATTNANEMIESLQMAFNRTRQAVITTELIEIISGSAALEG